MRFGLSLEGDCVEVEVTPNLEFLVTFGLSLEGGCVELVGDDISLNNLGTTSVQSQF